MSSIPRSRNPVARTFHTLAQALVAAIGRMDKSLSPSVTINKLRNHRFTLSDSIYIFHIASAAFWITVMQVPGFPTKLLIPVLYAILLLIPLTSQIFLPAIPVISWILTFYSCQFIPASWRPAVSVSLLPTLESVFYGANISDILTRFTHPALDILAWIPYGIVHYTFPFFVAIFLWLFRPKEALHFWAKAFGYMNMTGVLTQLIFPCSSPWYELIYGLTPASYSTRGSPGGLARIDALFHTHGYTTAFNNSPLVFGAFPSLHAGFATLEALFLTHFFPQTTVYIWSYVAVLYWSTMYLTHHYLIDVVGGACLATASFYLFLPDELRGPMATASPTGVLASPLSGGRTAGRNKYEVYDLEDPRRGRSGGAMMADAVAELSETSSDEEVDITYRSTPTSAVPLMSGSGGSGGSGNRSSSRSPSARGGEGSARGGAGAGGAKKSHRHTASIASLIRGDERSAEDGWSPVTASFPPSGSSRV
ncbi:hypothetical protein AX16_007168 [Volvariella volvacea WC 439]|nr:hypothetical protein AX16_007168 [Volvariella volvacea WC 439]